MADLSNIITSSVEIKLTLRELPIVQDNLPIFCDKLVCTIGNSRPCHTFFYNNFTIQQVSFQVYMPYPDMVQLLLNELLLHTNSL